jgi:hypothetical protein
MTNLFNPSLRKSLVRRLAVAAPALLSVILLAGGPADAKPSTTTSCNKKYNACIDRCGAKYGTHKWGGFTEKALACVRRTCERQLMNCLNNRTGSSSRPGEGTSEVPGDPPKGTGGYLASIGSAEALPNPLPKLNDNRGPLGGGILDGGPGMGTTGPSATGSPAGGGGRAPAAAPIQLR